MTQPNFEQIGHALTHVRKDDWDAVRIARVRRGMFRKRRRRRARRAVVASAAVLALAIGGGYQFWPQGPAAVENAVAEAGPTVRDNGSLTFADGTEVTPLVPGTELQVRENNDEQVTVALNGGSARFEVTPNRTRRFRVAAGEVNVEVLGTVFSVDRTGDQTSVNVERGVVRVEWDSGYQVLRVGQGGNFPPVVEEAEVVTSARVRHSVRRPRRAHWRSLADAEDYSGAYSALQNTSLSSAQDLWDAADVARRAGHPAEAVPYLERLLERYPQGRRAQNAAFTLGRVLTSLGRHRDAANAFHQAQQHGGGLAEAALAREAQALQSAGRGQQARQRANDYLRRYPNGNFARSLSSLTD